MKNKPILISELRGGLGNQLFQYAIGRAMALRTHTHLILDSSYLQGTLRTYALSSFPIKAQVQCSRLRGLAHRIWPRSANIVCVPIFQEHSFRYDERVMCVTSPVRLRGYWQSPKYFQEIISLLKQELSPPISHLDKHWLPQLSQPNSVAIHIRRGDYLHNPSIRAFQGIQQNSYYSAAIEQMTNKIPDPVFYVFSDDDDESFNEIQLPKSCKRVRAQNGFPTSEFALMSLCKNFIIANSTFSWWAAYLSQQCGGHVIYPKNWFAAPEMDATDLFPSHWHGI